MAKLFIPYLRGLDMVSVIITPIFTLNSFERKSEITLAEADGLFGSNKTCSDALGIFDLSIPAFTFIKPRLCFVTITLSFELMIFSELLIINSTNLGSFLVS